MFPYAFPNLVIAVSIAIYTLCETINSHTSYIGILKSTAFFIVFLLIAKSHYKNKPITDGDKAFIISFNLAIIPIVIADVYVVVDFFDGGDFRKSIMAYLLPFIYTPIIFLLSFSILYIWLKLSKKHNKS